jgi:hypothetical protein
LVEKLFHQSSGARALPPDAHEILVNDESKLSDKVVHQPCSHIGRNVFNSLIKLLQLAAKSLFPSCDALV